MAEPTILDGLSATQKLPINGLGGKSTGISTKPTSGQLNFRIARRPPKIGLQFGLYEAF